MPRYERLEHHELSPELRKIIAPDMPPAKRIALARGLIPLGTKDLLTALFYLSADPDKQVAKEAQKSLKDLPESITLVGLGTDLSRKLLFFVATRTYDNYHIYERIALHPAVDDKTLVHLAREVKREEVLQIIAGNEQAILRCPAILHGLDRNPQTPRSIVERLVKFYRIQQGREYRQDLPPELREEARRPVPEKVVEPDLPAPEVAAPALMFPDERLHPCVRPADLLGPDFDVADLFADELIQEPDEKAPDDRRVEKIPVIQRLARLSMVDKLLLAMRGNEEARKVLIRNPNKIIQEGVLQNPRIKVSEIVEAVKERSTSQAVIDRICNNREWTRYYEVMHLLCWNPKTPMRFIYRALGVLSAKDLRKLASSHNVAGLTRQQAFKMLQRREKRI